MLFADDDWLFFRASLMECIFFNYSKYMRKFQVKTEYWKTTMFFSKNTARLIQKTIKNILGVPINCHYEKYLGLPPSVEKTIGVEGENVSSKWI